MPMPFVYKVMHIVSEQSSSHRRTNWLTDRPIIFTSKFCVPCREARQTLAYLVDGRSDESKEQISDLDVFVAGQCRRRPNARLTAMYSVSFMNKETIKSMFRCRASHRTLPMHICRERERERETSALLSSFWASCNCFFLTVASTRSVRAYWVCICARSSSLFFLVIFATTPSHSEHIDVRTDAQRVHEKKKQKKSPTKERKRGRRRNNDGSCARCTFFLSLPSALLLLLQYVHGHRFMGVIAHRHTHVKKNERERNGEKERGKKRASKQRGEREEEKKTLDSSAAVMVQRRKKRNRQNRSRNALHHWQRRLAS